MTDQADAMKSIVKEKYADIAVHAGSCCGPSCGCSSGTTVSTGYSSQKGYVAEADLGLGCGIPTEVAGIREGQTVLDLGSGAGNDVFLAAHSVGPAGSVIGVDMTEAMVRRARENAGRLGITNVEFRLGECENLPIGSGTVDVVLSNCVLNLVPDKSRAFSEIMRVLKPGGRFAISDIVLRGSLPEKIRKSAEMYAGCVSGALPRGEYLRVIESAGFRHVTVHREKPYIVPEEALREILSQEETEHFRASGAGIFSITVTGEKSAP